MNIPPAPESNRTGVSTVLFPMFVLHLIGIEIVIDWHISYKYRGNSNKRVRHRYLKIRISNKFFQNLFLLFFFHLSQKTLDHCLGSVRSFWNIVKFPGVFVILFRDLAFVCPMSYSMAIETAVFSDVFLSLFCSKSI